MHFVALVASATCVFAWDLKLPMVMPNPQCKWYTTL